MTANVASMITVSALNGVQRIRHGFFTREGGVSSGIYESLNCGFGSADDPRNVSTNRARALLQLDLEPHALATVEQQHSDRVAVIDDDWTVDLRPVADALVTNRPGIALGVLTADCAPVLMVDAKASVIAAAHAGWRGALAGVLENTVAAMVRMGAKPSRVIAAVGPCIAQRSYEVGPEFPVPFLAEDPENHFFFVGSTRNGHHYFDLPGYIARRLARNGIGEVARTPCDTCREEGRFFSYRRSQRKGEADYGRMLSAIVLER